MKEIFFFKLLNKHWSFGICFFYVMSYCIMYIKSLANTVLKSINNGYINLS